MKSILLVVLVLASVAAKAEDSLLKSCRSGDARVEVLLDQTGADISMKVQEIARKYKPDQGAVKYNILSSEGVSYVVKDARLADLVADKPIMSGMILNSLFQLRMFDGEYDMVHYYVSKYMEGLKCN